jgi:hypothetical protein
MTRRGLGCIDRIQLAFKDVGNDDPGPSAMLALSSIAAKTTVHSEVGFIESGPSAMIVPSHYPLSDWHEAR